MIPSFYFPLCQVFTFHYATSEVEIKIKLNLMNLLMIFYFKINYLSAVCSIS